VKSPRRILKPQRRCNARKKNGERCRKYPIPGHRRCLFHGGKSTGPRPRYSNDGTRIEMAAANLGLAKWRERVRQEIKAGKIKKFPQGRKSNAERERIARNQTLSHPDQAAVSFRERLALDGKERPVLFDPVPRADQREVQRAVVRTAIVAGANLLDPLVREAIVQTIRAEFAKRGWKTDAQRRDELEKLLAPIRAKRALPASISVDREPPDPETANAPPPEPSPAEREQAEREAAVRAQEQGRLQAAYEQAEKIKAAGMARDSVASRKTSDAPALATRPSTANRMAPLG
jgi:hypothetical protein